MTHQHRTPLTVFSQILSYPLLLLLAAAAPGALPNNFQQTNLLSNGSTRAARTDVTFVNPMGLITDPSGALRIVGNGAGNSPAIDGTGASADVTVNIPNLPGQSGSSKPAAGVFSSSINPSDFPVATNIPASLIFATQGGTLAGWSPALGNSTAVIKVNNSSSGASFRGLALAGNGNGLMLFATDFAHSRIVVFNHSFQPVTLPRGAFVDPTLPRGFAPFGIHSINGNLVVTFALKNSAGTAVVPGAGQGFVDIFDPNGNLIRRLAARGTLNAPLGVALAPANFGPFSNALLVANSGDGTISAFDPASGRFLGQLRDRNGQTLRIAGLAHLAFGSGVASQSTNALFFTAGGARGTQGLFGRLTAAQAAERQSSVFIISDPNIPGQSVVDP